MLSIEEKTGQNISQTFTTIETNNYPPHIHFLTDRKADSDMHCSNALARQLLCKS